MKAETPEQRRRTLARRYYEVHKRLERMREEYKEWMAKFHDCDDELIDLSIELEPFTNSADGYSWSERMDSGQYVMGWLNDNSQPIVGVVDDEEMLTVRKRAQ